MAKEYLFRGAHGPDKDVLYRLTPKGAGVVWESLLPGLCRRCRQPVKLYADGWWEAADRRHADCDRIPDSRAVPPVRRVSAAQRTEERRTLMERHRLTEDAWEALPAHARRRLIAELRYERWNRQHNTRLESVVKGDDAGA